MIRKKKYFDVVYSSKEIRTMKKGNRVIKVLSDGVMLSSAMRNNLLQREYMRALTKVARLKRLMKKR